MVNSLSEEEQLDHFRTAGHWKAMLEGCDAVVAGDRPAKVAILLSGLSSGLSGAKLHQLAMGRSQSGKSWSQRRIGLHLFPNFEVVNSSSPKAPYYKAMKDPERYKNRIVLYEEFGDQGSEFQGQIKAFTSQGVDDVTLETVDDKRKFLGVSIRGLPTVWTNSATPLEGPNADQMLNRLWKVNVDETPAQDNAVQEYQRAEEKYGNPVVLKNETILRAKYFVSYILDAKNLDVVNPFADCWDSRCPARRNLRPMIISLVKSLAYSNRILRPYVGESSILASLSDNLIGFIVWSIYEKYQLKSVPGRYLKLLDALAPGRRYTKQELNTAYSDKYPDEPNLSPESCYQYAHYMVKRDLMGFERIEGTREVQFYALAVARSSSKRIYGKDGTLTSLKFESVEARIPKVEELAQILDDMKTASLTPWELTESSRDTASRLLDLDYAVLLAKTLELPFPSLSGRPDIVCNIAPLETVRDETLASLTVKKLEEGES